MPLSSPSGSPRRRRWQRPIEVAVVVLGLLATAVLVAAVSWPATNEVETGRTAEYPELRELLLRYSAPLVLARAVETVEELDGWRLVEVDDGAGVVRAEAETALLGFVDDVTVQVTALSTGLTASADVSHLPTLVRVRSASRVGRTDFGQNARNIERFVGALVANLELARQGP